MIKDIIANLSVTKEGSIVGKYAVSVAAALEAHLTGVAFIYDPANPNWSGYLAELETAAPSLGVRGSGADGGLLL